MKVVAGGWGISKIKSRVWQSRVRRWLWHDYLLELNPRRWKNRLLGLAMAVGILVGLGLLLWVIGKF
jgi:hypothetical protein